MTPTTDRPGPASQGKPREIQQKAKTLTDDIGELFDLYYKLGGITITEKISNAASISITVTIILSFLMFTLLFAGIGVGWYLGQVLDSMLAGYSIISAFFLICILVVLFLRKSVIFPLIRNTIVKKIYEQ